MFNGLKKASDPTYLFDLTRYYKIWFSTVSEQFLGIEDQLRFIRMRKDNPEAKLFFIYSTLCLSAEALGALEQFCKLYNIIPIAFEHLESMLQHEQDIALYKIAQQELTHCIMGKEGNMASASDCVRLLVPVIEEYGIYGDFDIRIQLSKLKADYLRLRGPFLFPAEILQLTSKSAALSPNSDFFACSLNEEKSQHLSQEALERIRRLQGIILKKYQSPFSAQTLFGMNKLSSMPYPELPKLFAEFDRYYPNDPSIYDFRHYVKTLPDIPENAQQGISAKTLLMRFSVINMSGPGNYSFLFADKLPKEQSEPLTVIPCGDKQWQSFLALYERCGINFYEPIYGAIESKNSVLKVLALRGKNAAKEGAEFSWTQEGMHRKQKREQKIIHATSILQGFWRRKLDAPEYKLYQEVKKVTDIAAILTPIKQNKLDLVLRRASSGIKLDIVVLLAAHYQKYPFNVNGIAATGSKSTALDWIMQAKATSEVKKNEQQEIIRILKSIGGKTAVELSEASLVLGR